MIKKTNVSGGVASLLALLLLSPIGAMAAGPAGKHTDPLTAKELNELYSDRTWVWKTGGGRFNAEKYRFLAYVKEKGAESYGQGRWDVDDNGKLCIRAWWHAADGVGGAATCFGHIRIGNTIYQRRFPNGHWYVFRHAPERSGDEARKLIAADPVSDKAMRLKQRMMKD